MLLCIALHLTLYECSLLFLYENVHWASVLLPVSCCPILFFRFPFLILFSHFVFPLAGTVAQSRAGAEAQSQRRPLPGEGHRDTQ